MRCRTKFSFELIHNQCLFVDKQYVKLQEIPEVVPDGETPQTLTLMAYEDYVDQVKPGDRINCVGIYRAQGVRVNSRIRTVKSAFKTYIDVVTYQKNK